ncbi:hypothetical protein [Kaistella polysaccharea]|uniref:hypothetical protein n=1 Tax=Kaistella polysaccharea TaxID=2878534 RepID=UPI001CF4DB76|nr:hypothetical protein [Kaistella polysaccharea]
MKNITYKNLRFLLPKSALLAVVGSLFLASCVSPLGGYTETDGVYYDPSTDTLPEGVMNNNGNRIGDYYDYQANDDQNKYLNNENRNQNWQDSQESDWGIFTGTDTYYSNNSWGYPYGMYSGFGFGMSYGFGYGGYYNPWGFGYNPFGNYYNPYYGYYSPYYGYYNPYSYYGGYNPYYSNYGYGYGYNSYNAPRFEYKRSGSNNGFQQNNSDVRRNSNQNNGFRNDNQRYQQNNQQQNNQQRNSQQPRYRTSPRIDNTPNTPRRQSVPQTYEPSSRSNSNDSYRSSGRQGGFDSGVSRSNSSSNSSSSSSSSSTRSSGGFRR